MMEKRIGNYFVAFYCLCLSHSEGKGKGLEEPFEIYYSLLFCDLLLRY